MLRFSVNRWWAFILALCLVAACSFVLAAQAPSVAQATSITSVATPEPDPSGSIGNNYGDPDVPVGPGQGVSGKTGVSRLHGSSAKAAISRSGPSPVGDGAVPASVVMEGLRLLLLSWRSLHFGF
jgi:hypothetical protein